jgi:hypothetical protein
MYLIICWDTNLKRFFQSRRSAHVRRKDLAAELLTGSAIGHTWSPELHYSSPHGQRALFRSTISYNLGMPLPVPVMAMSLEIFFYFSFKRVCYHSPGSVPGWFIKGLGDFRTCLSRVIRDKLHHGVSFLPLHRWIWFWMPFRIRRLFHSCQSTTFRYNPIRD